MKEKNVIDLSFNKINGKHGIYKSSAYAKEEKGYVVSQQSTKMKMNIILEKLQAHSKYGCIGEY